MGQRGASMRYAHRSLVTRAAVVAAVLAVALALAACGTAADALYCDQERPCTDPKLPRCDFVAHQCYPADDAGVGDAAPGDATPDSVPADSGCPAGSHSCNG